MLKKLEACANSSLLDKKTQFSFIEILTARVTLSVIFCVFIVTILTALVAAVAAIVGIFIGLIWLIVNYAVEVGAFIAVLVACAIVFSLMRLSTKDIQTNDRN